MLQSNQSRSKGSPHNLSAAETIIGLVPTIQILNAYTNRGNARSKKRSLLVNN